MKRDLDRFASCILLAALLCAAPLAAQKRPFTLEDFYRVKGVSDLAASKDGSRFAFTVTVSDLPRGKRTSRIWVMDATGESLRAVTGGESDGSGRFSPDGGTLAFVRTTGGTSNLWLLPFSGGESRQLTSISTGVADPLWSPNGKWIAFNSDVYPECGGDDVCNKKIGDRWSNGKLHAHMADSLLYRHWTGWKDGTVKHTFLANVEDGSVRDLTPGKFDYPPFQLGGPVPYDFSPDSSELVVMSNHDPNPATSTNSDLWLISLTGPATEPRNITAANHAFDGSPKYSPDGRSIAYRMQKQPAYESDLFRLAVYDRAGGQSRVLTESHRNWVDSFDWSDDSRDLYFTGPVEGRNPILRVAADGSGSIERLFADRTVDAFRFSRDLQTVVYIGRSVGKPSEIYRGPVRGASSGARAATQQLTHFNDQLLAQVDFRPAEEMWVPAADGSKIHTFIVKPHDFDPAKKYPLILNVHGGPQQMWADAFRGDWQVYPGAGYIVAFCNPHGSTGYGQDYTAAISGDWGGKPYDDLMRVTDALEKLPYVDRDRIGAMGWSYGGYMMNWFEGHTTRYKAIVSMMGLYDLRSFYGATEELWFPEWDLRGQPWSSPQYESMSPSSYATNFKTPCLVITGERDYRVPYTQGLQMFTALQKMSVPSRLVVYSNAGHWPSWYEMALYYTAHLDWFHRYLGGGAPPWSPEAFLRNAVFDASGKRVEEEPAPENLQGKPDVKPQ
jgi:dipeptidyl aminopeptidase/acylaminoacyl peptidase